MLWDVDYTLLAADGVGRHLYELVFAELFGAQLPTTPVAMAGRTDSAIALDVLTLAGLPDPGQQLPAFQAALAARAPEMTGLVQARGRVLPGAAEALAALAGHRGDSQVIQSVLTGNIRQMAWVKLTALGLTEHLDLAVGAYGEASGVRADLVEVARRNALVSYGHDFDGRATVLVGDTPGDVEAAVATGARAVGVATGSFSTAELLAAGADAALPDLSDTGLVLSAILGVPSG